MLFQFFSNEKHEQGKNNTGSQRVSKPVEQVPLSRMLGWVKAPYLEKTYTTTAQEPSIYSTYA